MLLRFASSILLLPRLLTLTMGAVYLLAVYGVIQGSTGVTPGKAALKIRVASGNGRPPGVGAGLIRTVFLPLDSFLMIGVVLMVGSPGHRRLGDSAAGTFVVRKMAAGKALPVERFRLGEPQRAVKTEDPVLEAKRQAQAAKRQKRRQPKAEPYIVPWKPGVESEAAARAKEADLKEFKCLRCGHAWLPRQREVRICPKCKSAWWDKPKMAKKAKG